MELTRELAFAAGEDEANRSMRREGRTSWNKADYGIATQKTNELLDVIEAEVTS